MKRTAMMAVASMMLLGSCAHVQTSGVCPSLDDPPSEVVDALEQAARETKEAADWVIGLSQHYDNLDVCHAVIS